MSPLSLALNVAAVAVAYLIGSIPFGFLTARWVRGIDIRTVGSGNIGATNVGRVLGFHFFLLVFGLDLLKGLLPTLWFPDAVRALGGRGLPELRVLVALATILGHNFPAYLETSRGQRGRDQPGGAAGARPVRERGHGRGVRDLPDRHPLCLAFLAPGRACLRGRPFRSNRPPLGS